MKLLSLKHATLTAFSLVLLIHVASAQNYKAPKIDASGKITDKQGNHVGNVSKEGVITDVAGNEIAHVDGNGILIDATTGKKLGKAEKNGNFVPYLPEPKGGWVVGPPMNGVCLVKDENGKVVAEVHESYKQFGACAIHCTSHNMDHNKVREMDHSKMQKMDHSKMHHGNANDSTYTCPMHPDVTSAKPGKCSKCGMPLEKMKK